MMDHAEYLTALSHNPSLPVHPEYLESHSRPSRDFMLEQKADTDII